MDFIDKLIKFDNNYIKIKKIIKKAIKNKLIKTGSGGSNNIIIINDNYALKIVPNIKNNLLKINSNNDYLEGDIYKVLTEQFIKTKITPHIVGIYKKYIIEDIKILFSNKCLTTDEKLLLNKTNENEQLCFLKEGYKKNIVTKKASLLVLENCPITISDKIEKILKMKWNIKKKINIFNKTIKRIIFQLIYTLAIIQQVYPDFIHNDLFLRNILATIDTNYEPEDYVEYKFNSKIYYIPANGIYIKLNDFGYSLGILKNNSTLENGIKNSIISPFEIYNPYRDIYTFFFDLYNGPNYGSQSLKSLIYSNIKNKTHQKLFIKNIKKEIGKFFNYKIIDKIQSKNETILDWKWNVSDSKLLMQSVKKPIDYFNMGLFDSYTKLPVDGRIVNIFNL